MVLSSTITWRTSRGSLTTFVQRVNSKTPQLPELSTYIRRSLSEKYIGCLASFSQVALKHEQKNCKEL